MQPEEQITPISPEVDTAINNLVKDMHDAIMPVYSVEHQNIILFRLIYKMRDTREAQVNELNAHIKSIDSKVQEIYQANNNLPKFP